MRIVPAVVSLALMPSRVDQVTATQLRNKKQAHRQHMMTKPHPRPKQGGSEYSNSLLIKCPSVLSDGGDINRRKRGGGG